MLYEPTRFDALIDEPWVASRVEDAIAAIVALKYPIAGIVLICLCLGFYVRPEAPKV